MSDKRFYIDHGVDGWPIVDRLTLTTYSRFDKEHLINLLNDLAEKADQSLMHESELKQPIGLDFKHAKIVEEGDTKLFGVEKKI